MLYAARERLLEMMWAVKARKSADRGRSASMTPSDALQHVEVQLR
jgi:hypothetical protein